MVVRRLPTIGTVYDALLRFCPPYRLTGPWAGVPIDPAVRGAPRDPAGVVADLADAFPPAILTRAGVARATADNGLTPADALRTDGPWVFLRSERNGEPFAVVTPDGCLGGHDLPVVAALKDQRTAQALAADPERQLWVTASTADMTALRAVGLPAALVRGLEDFGAPQLTALCGAFGWRARVRGDADPAPAGEQEEVSAGPRPQPAAPTARSGHAAGRSGTHANVAGMRGPTVAGGRPLSEHSAAAREGQDSVRPPLIQRDEPGGRVELFLEIFRGAA
jgi:hypothetical protein